MGADGDSNGCVVLDGGQRGLADLHPGQQSTGTFYNHFPSLADLVDEVTGRLLTGVEIGETTLAAIENDA
ncbi:MAG: hypothetical protein AAFN30_20930, partial [Actinomycetota bacterium]